MRETYQILLTSNYDASLQKKSQIFKFSDSQILFNLINLNLTKSHGFRHEFRQRFVVVSIS